MVCRLIAALLLALITLPGHTAVAKAQSKTYQNPAIKGVRLDACKHWGRQCGQPAADLFCQQMGFQGADKFQIEDAKRAPIGALPVQKRTLVFGDGRICSGPDCRAFTLIRCVKSASPPPGPGGGDVKQPEAAFPGGARISRCRNSSCSKRSAERFKLSSKSKRQTLRFAWNVRRVPGARGALFQVASLPFARFAKGGSRDYKPSGSLRSDFIRGTKGRVSVDFKTLTKAIKPNPRHAITKHYYVRVFPTLGSKIVGRPSNTLRIDYQIPKQEPGQLKLPEQPALLVRCERQDCSKTATSPFSLADDDAQQRVQFEWKVGHVEGAQGARWQVAERDFEKTIKGAKLGLKPRGLLQTGLAYRQTGRFTVDFKALAQRLAKRDASKQQFTFYVRALPMQKVRDKVVGLPAGRTKEKVVGLPSEVLRVRYTLRVKPPLAEAIKLIRPRLARCDDPGCAKTKTSALYLLENAADQSKEFRWTVGVDPQAQGVVWQVIHNPDATKMAIAAAGRNAEGLLVEQRADGTSGSFNLNFKELKAKIPSGRLRLPGEDRDAAKADRFVGPRFYVRALPIKGGTPVQPTGKSTNIISVYHGPASDCRVAPELCCPDPQKTRMCKKLAETILDIGFRSYMPPRLTMLGDHGGVDTSVSYKMLVADVKKSKHGISPGCRFSPNAIRNRIRRDKGLLKQVKDLGAAIASQWAGFYEDAQEFIDHAKSYVSSKIADGICDTVSDTAKCRQIVADLTSAGMDAGLASMGLPPNLPDLDNLENEIIDYAAAGAASEIMAGAEQILEGLPVDDETRQQLYNEAYDVARTEMKNQLEATVPKPKNVDDDNPFTWGHVDPAFLAHHARVYVRVAIKDRQTYRRFLQKRGDRFKWPVLTMWDDNNVYKDPGEIQVPKYIPANGLIIPLRLLPGQEPLSKKDRWGGQMPGGKISMDWVYGKFGIRSPLNHVTAQWNWKCWHDGIPTGEGCPDFDLFDRFYRTVTSYKFRLDGVSGSETIRWGDLSGTPGYSWDSVNSPKRPRGTVTRDFYGRIVPARLCGTDSRP